MLVEEQISARQERARAITLQVLSRPDGQVWGDYSVKSPSGRSYRVAMRGPGLFDNYCSCPDFAVNTLGTCKHVEALLLSFRKRHRSLLEGQRYERTRASVSLHYGDTLAVRLALPRDAGSGLRTIAGRYCDAEGLLRPEFYPRFDAILDELRRLDETAVVYSDVLAFLDREIELGAGLETERRLLRRMSRGEAVLEGLVNARLFPYQVRGALFLACRGRAVLADDMGLGKTIQAIAAAEFLRRQRGIRRVLVVAPASVKYQWKTEIERFTDLPVQVIDGPLPQRRRLYVNATFFNLTSYELVLKDLEALQDLRPDLVILDEAQRIRNWTTATARTVKQLKSRYAFVLTGTPLENKLEELYSVVEFVDGRRLGPAFRFLKEHRIEDDKGKLLGYRGLDEIHRRLQPLLLRRTRSEVLPELPERTDQVFRVPMTEQQAGPYGEQSDILARLVHKWERQGWLSEIDLRRVSCCLQNMRMLCNSTFLFDKETRVSPKLDEFREIVRELAIEESRKVVVFSEYERMTWLAGEELNKMRIGFVSLHGGVPGRKRGGLIERFRRDPECRVFLSTDAGGVGLNLQMATAVINFEPPWNPARLEQRIGRVHRMGQQRPVQVIHLLTRDSIEEHVWETLRLKKALFAGLFDSGASEVNFAKLGRKSVLQAVKEVIAEQRPALAPLEAPARPSAVSPPAAHSEGKPVSDVAGAAAALLEAGLRLVEALAVPDKGLAAAPSLGAVVSGLVRTAPDGRHVLAIPLPAALTADRIAGALQSLLGRFAARA